MAVRAMIAGTVRKAASNHWLIFAVRVRRMLRSERGSVAIQLGLMMIIILGMVGLGVEITFVLYKHRQMQSAADWPRLAASPL